MLKKQNKKTKFKSKVFFLISTLSIGVSSLTIYGINNLSLNTNKIVKNESSKNDSSSENTLTPLDQYYKTPILTSKTGPITSYGSKISSLDWYGSTRWSFDFYDSKNLQYLPGGKKGNWPSWAKRAFMSWTIDTNNNRLWILTNSQQKQGDEWYPQNILCLDLLNGNVLSCTPIDYTGTNQVPGRFTLYNTISLLANGNIMVHWLGNFNWGYNFLYDYQTKKFKFSDLRSDASTKSYIEDNVKKTDSGYSHVNGEIKLQLIIPIYENVNVVVFQNFGIGSKTTDAGWLYLALLDDNMKKINVPSNNPFYNLIRIRNIYDVSNSTLKDKFSDVYSKSYYTTLDGRVYFTAFEKFFVFFPDKSKNSVDVKEYKLDDNKNISSFTMDVNENVFFKYIDDTKIYKLKINGNTINGTVFATDTYYDLSGSSVDEIKKYASTYILYNVTSYSGSIMLLNAKIHYSGTELDNTGNDTGKGYGIAAAISPNINDENKGDSKGLLNTNKSFQKASDFTISDSVLNTKIPSEITRNDLTLLNDGFLTSNTTKNEDGTLKYVPFEVTEIDDANGKFKVTVNLDQIPWFAKTLPSGSIPKTIAKEFQTTKKIDSKVSWKDQDALSYDFRNTLPSKISTTDLNNFDPLQVSFNSKIVLDSNGSQIYPKKTYSVETHDDVNGTVTIKVAYQYVPLSSETNNPLTYTATKQYNVFKSGDKKEFYFAGSTTPASETSTQEININNVPQLKSLIESNLLPSSFNGSDRNQFLQFINTNNSKGYPISKINFSVEPNDIAGTLKVTASVNKNYDSQGQTFVQIFSGFNKKTNYKFNFQTSANSINKKEFSSMLASSVNEGDVINYLINYDGFNSSDFEINLYPDDTNGQLLVQINLDKSYVSELGNSNGFSNYQASYTFTGFMTNENYNNQYNIVFVDDNDSSLIELKKLTLKNIDTKLNTDKNLEIDGKKYTSLNQLIEELFIKTKGSKIPTNWNNNDKIKTTMTYDNQAGTMNLAISIDKSLLDGYDSDLNYVISYSGFSKGNAVVTDDNLTFVSNSLLKSYVEEIKDMNASQIKSWLEQDKKNIKKLLFNVTGEYETKIDSNDFKLEINVNNSYNTISITISFDNLKNTNSLKEYSTQYKL